MKLTPPALACCTLFALWLASPSRAHAGEPEPAARPAAPASRTAEGSRPAARTPAALAPRQALKRGARRTVRARVTRRHRRRRTTLRGYAPPRSSLRKTPPPRPTGQLRIYSINLRESLELSSIYDARGRLEPEAIAAVSRILRDPGSGLIKPIEPRLIEVLSMAYEHFGHRQLVLVSGFRAPRGSLNYHSRGAAADVKIAGVSAPRLRDYFRSIDTGGMGIGIYPGSGFVHVDVRPPPSYYWVDAGTARRPAKRRRAVRKTLMPELAGAQ